MELPPILIMITRPRTHRNITGIIALPGLTQLMAAVAEAVNLIAAIGAFREAGSAIDMMIVTTQGTRPTALNQITRDYDTQQHPITIMVILVLGVGGLAAIVIGMETAKANSRVTATDVLIKLHPITAG